MSLLLLPSSNMKSASWFHLTPTNKSLQKSSQKPSPWGCLDSWHLFFNFHLYFICFFGLCFWGFFHPNAFLLRNTRFQAGMTTSCFCWVFQATLVQKRVPGMSVKPSLQVSSRPSCRQLCPVQSRAAAVNSTARQHKKHRSLCSNFCPAPLLFSSTAIPFGTDQDLASDHSKICLLTRGNSQHLLSPPYSFCHWKRWCLPLGSHFLDAQQYPVFPYSWQLVQLLLEGISGVTPRKLGFSTDTESCTYQE